MKTTKTPRLKSGPQKTGTQVPKFWNIASTGDDTGEILSWEVDQD